MPSYFTLTAELPEADAELASSLLFDAGAQGVEVRDAELKVMPGQRAPAPGQAILVAFFGDAQTLAAARAELAEAYPAAQLEQAEQPEQDWSEAWKAQVRSVVAGRFWVGPPWDEPKAPAGKVRIVIEPGMAFGTGDHPTTRFCLESVDEVLARRPGASVLDVGTGSGVLAIAARKAGSGRTVGTDNDPVAIRVAIENADKNRAPGLELSTLPLEQVSGQFDLVLANILANTLVELAPAIAKKVAPGGELYLAGILAPQVDEVLAAYTAQGLTQRVRKLDGEWALLGVERGA